MAQIERNVPEKGGVAPWTNSENVSAVQDVQSNDQQPVDNYSNFRVYFILHRKFLLFPSYFTKTLRFQWYTYYTFWYF